APPSNTVLRWPPTAPMRPENADAATWELRNPSPNRVRPSHPGRNARNVSPPMVPMRPENALAATSALRNPSRKRPNPSNPGRRPRAATPPKAPIRPVNTDAAASTSAKPALKLDNARVMTLVDPANVFCIRRELAVIFLVRAPTVASPMDAPIWVPAPTAATFAALVACFCRFDAKPCMLGRTLIQTAPTVAIEGAPPLRLCGVGVLRRQRTQQPLVGSRGGLCTLPCTFLFDLVHRTRQRVGHLHRFGAFGVDGYGDRRECPDSVRCLGEQVLHLTPFMPPRGPVDGTVG